MDKPNKANEKDKVENKNAEKKIPKEILELVGGMVSFIENIDKLNK
ncbi:hypothetical protein [Alkalithermobacter paradoxus]|uniref:Uncharacterized protein n=1 Tax=Alkalithermobacter paradoxus TaxID=29349 RepID=A0A1V4I836_9FIRM|nr:hypothetical protein CLOTH_12180 [[Clostridium] thermoalcaliphilum]